jgi:hypothetical protein
MMFPMESQGIQLKRLASFVVLWIPHRFGHLWSHHPDGYPASPERLKQRGLEGCFGSERRDIHPRSPL